MAVPMAATSIALIFSFKKAHALLQIHAEVHGYLNPTTPSGDTASKIIHSGLGKFLPGAQRCRHGFGRYICLIAKKQPILEVSEK